VAPLCQTRTGAALTQRAAWRIQALVSCNGCRRSNQWRTPGCPDDHAPCWLPRKKREIVVWWCCRSGLKNLYVYDSQSHIEAHIHIWNATVDLATLIPSWWSSPTMRGEPHVGLDRHISWMSSRTSLEIAGRPGLPLWLRRRQSSRNRFFCQAMTVRGCTNASACCQSGHRRESQAQRRRSDSRSFGRETRC
jgi:hypothetical protein